MYITIADISVWLIMSERGTLFWLTGVGLLQFLGSFVTFITVFTRSYDPSSRSSKESQEEEAKALEDFKINELKP